MLVEEGVLVTMVGKLGGSSDDTRDVIIRVLLNASYRLVYTIVGHSEAIPYILFVPEEEADHPIYNFKHRSIIL